MTRRVWLSTIAVTLIALLSAFACLHFKGNPWVDVNARAQLTVLNQTQEPCAVSVQAGTQSWALGAVPAQDSVTWELPFADQRILAWICGLPTILDIDGPKRWRLVAKYRSAAEAET